MPADAALAGLGAGADAGQALKATLAWDEPDGGGSTFVAYNRHLPEDLTSYNRYRLVDEEELRSGASCAATAGRSGPSSPCSRAPATATSSTASG